MYVAACYPVGTGMCHNMVGLLQHYRGPEGPEALTDLLNNTKNRYGSTMAYNETYFDIGVAAILVK